VPCRGGRLQPVLLKGAACCGSVETVNFTFSGVYNSVHASLSTVLQNGCEKYRYFYGRHQFFGFFSKQKVSETGLFPVIG
jgi:hypothetical protein